MNYRLARLRAAFPLLLALSIARGGRAAPGPEPPCPESIPALYQEVSPSVVSISASSKDGADPAGRMGRVAGSGLILDPKGLIVTNSHVVFGRQAILVTLDDGKTLPARLLGADPLLDIAILQIPPPATGELPAARLGDSAKLAVGEEVFAIGNPYGLDQTFTRGIVSAVNRLLPGPTGSAREPLVQTDAAVNPGSSGGPLVDRCGRVVGITTAMMPGAQSIGFAIPIDIVKSTVPALLSDGRIIRPWLGVGGQVVPRGMKELLRLPLVDGFLVESVDPSSPAGRAGLHGGDLDITVGGDSCYLGGDIITEVNGARGDDPAGLVKAFGSLKVGETAHLTLYREGAARTVDVVMAERPLLPGDVRDRQGAASGNAEQSAARAPSAPSPRRAF